MAVLALFAVVGGGPHEQLASAAEGSLEEIHTIPLSQVPDADINAEGVQPSPLAIDEANDLGVAVGRSPLTPTPAPPDNPNDDRGILLYDMATLNLADVKYGGSAWDPADVLTWAVDGDRRRIFAPQGIPGSPMLSGSTVCTNGVQTTPTIRYDQRSDGSWYFPVDPAKPNNLPVVRINIPCPNGLPIVVEAASIGIDPETKARKLYILGSYDADIGSRGLVEFFRIDARDNDGQSMLIRQIDLATLDGDEDTPANPAAALDWEIDLRYAGCGRLVSRFVARTQDSVVTYCTDPTPAQYSNPVGEQGYVVRVDLDPQNRPKLVKPDGQDGKPLNCGINPPDQQPVDACRVPDPVNPQYGVVNAATRRTPTLSGRVEPFLDAQTGRLMLLTNNKSNGNAVWVFDVFQERFIGVMTHGQAEATADKNGVGFDLVHGRAYLFSPNGIIIGPARQDPPLAGLRYRVLDDEDDRMSTPRIAVVPNLRRLVFPMNGQGYVVLHDNVPDPPDRGEVDLDRLTTQIEEVPGETTANVTGAAEASGLHVLVPGGVTRPARQADPACAMPALQDPGVGLQPFLDALHQVNEGALLDGDCVWDRLVRTGNREFSVGRSEADASNSTGVTATGEPVVFASDDEASDHDVKSAGECERTKIEDGAGAVITHFGPDGEPMKEGVHEALDGYSQLCDGVHTAREQFEENGGDRLYEEGLAPLPDPRAGTAGRDDGGFPGPKAVCAVSSGSVTDDSALATRDEFGAGVFTSQAFCDRDNIVSAGRAEAAGVAMPSDQAPLVTVGSVWSRTASQRSEVDGTVTTAIAGANDVRIGPMGIEMIYSLARAQAHGRTRTARTDLDRYWCNITLNGQPLVAGCVDPDSPQVKAVVDRLNQSVQRVRITIPPANSDEDGIVPPGNGDPTKGGYQAVVFKDESVQAADATVNDDTSQTVPALQVVLYNDGAEGRSRVVAQFAGVKAESRYGIIALPDFPPYRPPDFTPPPTLPDIVSEPGVVAPYVPATPDEYGFVVRGARAQSIASTSPDDNPLRRFLRGPLAALGGALKWLVENPVEFGLLFAMWSVLGVPVYQIVRRRSFEQALLE